MWLFVGLGNPGARHQNNRHNIGFMAVDELSRRHSFQAWKKKFQSEVTEGKLAGERTMLLKPQTFMNVSGLAVLEAARFHKITLDSIFVFHDELDLEPGKMRVKRGGGSAGHNGLSSLDEHIGPNYWRVRLGIGHPGDKGLVSGHVLGDFLPSDSKWLHTLMGAVATESEKLVCLDSIGFMNNVARTMQAVEPKKEKEGS